LTAAGINPLLNIFTIVNKRLMSWDADKTSAFVKASVPDPCHFGMDPDPDPDLRIRTSDCRIQIRIWIRLRILLFLSVTFKMPPKNYFYFKCFCSLLFEGTFTSFFMDKNSERSHKTVEIKGFLTILA
jgi:hypothetical protein